MFLAPGEYRDSALGGLEDFPYYLLPGVRIEYWDRLGQLPGVADPVRFEGSQQSATVDQEGYAFVLQDGAVASADCGLFGYLDLSSPSTPEDRAGFKFAGFQGGAVYLWQQALKPWSQSWRFSVDGCHSSDSSRLIEVLADAGVQRGGEVIVSRCFGRLPSTSAAAYVKNDVPIIEIEVSGGAELGVRIVGVDIRPDGLVGESSLVAAEVRGVGTQCLIRMDQCVLEGRDLGSAVTGVGYKGAGIEVVAKERAKLEFDANELQVRDARGDGILAVVQGGVSNGNRTVGIFELSDSEIEGNGFLSPSAPYISSKVLEFSRSGVHVVVGELGRWTSVKVDSAVVRENYRHGIFFDSFGRFEFNPGFPLCEVQETESSGNGLTLDPFVRGDGVFCSLWHDSMLLGLTRCLLKGNQSSGLFARVDCNDELNPDYFRLLAINSVITGNQGVRTTEQVGDEWSSPIAVEYTRAANGSGWLRLSGLTVTDNIARYGLAVFASDDASHSRDEIVGSSSTVIENSVFRGNVPATGTEQSYFPVPTTPIWDALWARTHNCCLEGNTLFYIPGIRSNIVIDPELRSYSIAGIDFGVSFPCSVIGGCLMNSPLLDAGRSPGVPEATGKDIRGFVRPGSTAGDTTYDIGAFELQDGEK